MFSLVSKNLKQKVIISTSLIAISSVPWEIFILDADIAIFNEIFKKKSNGLSMFSKNL